MVTTSRFLETRRANVPGPALDPARRRHLLEAVGGVPIYRKTAPSAPRNPSSILEVGEIIRQVDLSVWEVVKVGPGSADIRCLRGRRAGDVVAVARSRAGFRFVSRDEL